MSTSKIDNVQSIEKTKFVWGAKLTSNNYKSVTIHGELFALGDCVRCPLKLKDGHVGKIIKLSQKEDRKMCKIRSFFSSSEFPSNVKGLNYTPNPKELFLASGEGLNVENDILLNTITSKCIVLCTAKENFNEMPSCKQIEGADYFFCRGYDPINQEIVGLDTVEEAIGAQKIYNKKDWLVDKTIGQSFLQEAMEGIHTSTCEVLLVLPKDSMERKLKRKNNNLELESPKIDVVEKINESHTPKKFKSEENAIPIEKSNAHYEHLVFAIQAPSKIMSNQRLEVLPIKDTSHVSSMCKAKVIHQEEKGGSFEVSGSFLFSDYSKQNTSKDEESNIENVERKNKDMFGEGTLNKNIKSTQSSKSFVEKRKTPKLQKKTIEGVVIAPIQSSKTISAIPISQIGKVLPARNVVNAKTSNSNVMKMDLITPYTSLCNSKEKPHGQIFKPKIEDWNISLVPAIQSNRVLLLKNLISGLHSDDLAEIFTHIMKIKCEVRIVPPVSSNYQTTMALLKLPSAKKAQDVIYEMESKYILVANRLVTATLFNYLEFKAPQLSKYHGHLEFPKEGRDHINDDYRNVVATSHLAQGNTIEFAFGLPWRVLDEQHEEQWQMLHEIHYSNSNKKIKMN